MLRPYATNTIDFIRVHFGVGKSMRHRCNIRAPLAISLRLTSIVSVPDSKKTEGDLTSLVAIKCRDGVVIGSDSAATFGDGHMLRTIEQTTAKKIEIIGDRVVVAGTGYVGHQQRFSAVVRRLWSDGAFQGKTDIEIGKMLSEQGLRDFASTHVQNLSYSAFVAYPASNDLALCELPGAGASVFQPELKLTNDLWFASAGSGQPITDPFLALLRKVFWNDGAPDVQGGVFAAMWALSHACEVNPGGINLPIAIAVLKIEKGKPRAYMLQESELQEQADMVGSATEHMRKFRDILEGKIGAIALPAVE